MDAAWLLLLVTWLVVIPYLVFCPPQLLVVRRKLRLRRERKVTEDICLKEQWRLAPSGNTPTSAGPSAPRWLIPKSKTTVIALVNRKSGGQLGQATLSCLHKLLHPGQVFDLAETPDIGATLRRFTGDVRVLICGGDGTISWAMDAATTCGVRPPMAVLPLGTGNDMSRSLGWGAGFGMGDVSTDVVRDTLVKMATKAKAEFVDRWLVTIKPANGSPSTQRIMINYFSLGVDAEISLRFHRERIDFPERFSSQTKNVVKYAWMGFEAAFDGRPLGDSCNISAGGEPLDVKGLWKGVIISNVPYYHGGKNFWGAPNSIDDHFGPASTHDGKLEVMGLAGTFHIGLCNIHVDNALRVGQDGSIVVQIRDDMAVQIDGEPFPQPPATLTFQRLDQYPMLRVEGA